MSLSCLKLDLPIIRLASTDASSRCGASKMAGLVTSVAAAGVEGVADKQKAR
jgi:hypothetical protein